MSNNQQRGGWKNTDKRVTPGKDNSKLKKETAKSVKIGEVDRDVDSESMIFGDFIHFA